MKLDSKTVTGLKLPDGKSDVIHFDSALPGFGFRVRASGNEVRKSWVVQYRRAGGTRRMLLGSAEVLTAEQARAVAKKTLATVALGQDPQAEKAARRSADKFTLAAMIEDYLASKESSLRARTFAEVQRYLRGLYFKPLHGMHTPGCRNTAVGYNAGERRCKRRQCPQRAKCVVRMGASQRTRTG